MKPVASGCAMTQAGLRNDDALALWGAMNVRARYEDVSPYNFLPPIAPHIAARESGVTIDFAVLDRCYERLALLSDVTVVEGAGGWLVPLDERRSFADLAAHWQLDVVLVVGLRLGCVNHALLTVESIHRQGCRLAGWVGNGIDPEFDRHEANVASLRSRISAPCIGILPHAPDARIEQTAALLMQGLPEIAPAPRP